MDVKMRGEEGADLRPSALSNLTHTSSESHMPMLADLALAPRITGHCFDILNPELSWLKNM